MHPGISAQHTYTDMRCYTRSLPRAGALCEGRSLAAARAARDDPVVPLEARLARLLWVLFLVKRADRAQVGRQLRRRLPLRLSRRAALHERLEVFVYTRKPLGFHTRVVEAGTQDLQDGLERVVLPVVPLERPEERRVRHVLRTAVQRTLQPCKRLLADRLQHVVQLRDLCLRHRHAERRPVQLRFKRLVHAVSDEQRHAAAEGNKDLAVAVATAGWCQAESAVRQVPHVVLVGNHDRKAGAVPVVVVHELPHALAVALVNAFGAVGPRRDRLLAAAADAAGKQDLEVLSDRLLHAAPLRVQRVQRGVLQRPRARRVWADMNGHDDVDARPVRLLPA
mmetsp:Transcript_40270/g.120105  ORF Transcript_40270/g.120105 Transcript_40270/m.120105 type:complete len:337 (+) Transcript_40270:544-1554(+)